MLDRAWELGATFWDTAQEYGDSEVLIGKWFKRNPERRKDIFLATKFGLKWMFTPEKKVKLLKDSSPEEARKVCDEALEKLGVDYIDLFYVHRFDGVVPVEKTMEALVALKKYVSLFVFPQNVLHLIPLVADHFDLERARFGTSASRNALPRRFDEAVL